MATTAYIREKKEQTEKFGVSTATCNPNTRTMALTRALEVVPMMALDVFLIWVALLSSLVAVRAMLARSGTMATAQWLNPLGSAYLGLFMLIFLTMAANRGLYSRFPAGSGWHESWLVTQASILAGLLLCGTLYMFNQLMVSRLALLCLVAASVMVLSVRRMIWRSARYRHYERGVDLRNVLVLGTHRVAASIGEHMRSNPRLGYSCVGFLTVANLHREVARNQILGGLSHLEEAVRMNFVDEVLIAEYVPTEEAIRLVDIARDLGVNLYAIAGFYPELTANRPADYIGSFPVNSLHNRIPPVIPLFFKRGIDLVVSSAMLLILLPVMLVIAIAIRLDSRGPVFYVSERVGKRGALFHCLKFRSMVTDAERLKASLLSKNERDGILFKMSNDPRITSIGRFLRKYSLDELPQLINVLCGDMSLVGPRPPLASEVEKYEMEHLKRLEVTPGLTGLWQVQARQDASFSRYIELDTAYVENWTLLLDLKILLRTAGVVLQGTGK